MTKIALKIVVSFDIMTFCYVFKLNDNGIRKICTQLIIYANPWILVVKRGAHSEWCLITKIEQENNGVKWVLLNGGTK